MVKNIRFNSSIKNKTLMTKHFENKQAQTEKKQEDRLAPKFFALSQFFKTGFSKIENIFFLKKAVFLPHSFYFFQRSKFPDLFCQKTS